MCSFLEHIYLLIVVSSLVFQNAFTHFTHDFNLLLSPWCFEVISGIFGDFKVFYVAYET